MRKWANTGAKSLCRRSQVLDRPRRLRSARITSARLQFTRSLSTDDNTWDSPGFSFASNSSTVKAGKSLSFERVDFSSKNIDQWIALLDQALPPRLRCNPEPLTDHDLNARDVAGILLAAQHPRRSTDPAFDLLHHMGFEQGRWTAVVLIVKKLVEAFPSPHAQRQHMSRVVSIWDKHSASLNEITSRKPPRHAVNAAIPLPAESPAKARTLDQVTEDPGDLGSFESRLPHRALGQIWRSIGAMTQSCAGGEIKPEILEIIAFLHHNEIMPLSIYQYETHPDKSAIQQPPLLTLLSSRILTSLSDAAWRAHEKLMIEEAKAHCGEYDALRPEIPGSVYRVHVAGLRPEVWMELILWSCLQGGWLSQGAAVLGSICQDRSWKPLSWREWQKKLLPRGVDVHEDLAGLDFVFKTKSPSTRDPPASEGLDVDVGRTVSAEVINAYIDALANTVAVGVGFRGTMLRSLTDQLHQLKNFLKLSDLSLSSGSWDAVITRLVDIQSFNPEVDAKATIDLVRLSPMFGQELTAENTQELPSYVMDGSAAALTLLHRALMGQIAAGSFEGALSVFKEIQMRADADKRKSIVDFMTGNRRLFETDATQDMFTSNFAGIDYPGFDVPIPPDVLASFLDLTTDEKAYDFGNWLLHRQDVDGPVIGTDLYNHPAVQPAILRFAAVTDDKALLGKLQGYDLSSKALMGVANTQTMSMRWEAVRRILQVTDQFETVSCDASILVHLACVMLGQLENAANRANLDEAKQLFEEVICGRFDRGTLPISEQNARNTILAILPIADPTFTDFCLKCRPLEERKRHPFCLSTSNFNSLLDAVVAVKGSGAGRQLLYNLWPPGARRAHDSRSLIGRRRPRRQQMPRYRPHALDSIAHQQIVLPVPGLAEASIAMNGAVIPNMASIFIILRKALEELASSARPPEAGTSIHDDLLSLEDVTASTKDEIVDDDIPKDRPRRMVIWAIDRLAELPSVPDTVLEELDRELASLGLNDLRAALSSLVTLQSDGEHLKRSGADDDDDDTVV